MALDTALGIAAPFTASWEGYRAYPYFDVNGYAIGYGNHFYQDGTQVQSTDGPISKADALQLLQDTLNEFAQTVQSLVTVPLTDNMLAALTDLEYNWGPGNFANSKLLGLINSGADPAAIVNQWQVTATTAGGVPNSDLVKRRAAEASLAFAQSQSSQAGLGLFPILLLLAAGYYFFVLKKR